MYQKWLEAFHHVADEGSFTRAAQKLNVGQPTISSHVGNLEARFGVELFHRKGRSIRLTAAGRTLHRITRDLHGHTLEAIAFLDAAKNLETGELRFSAVGPYDVMELLVAFRAQRPGIKCSVRLGLIEDVLRRPGGVQNRTLDLSDATAPATRFIQCSTTGTGSMWL